MREVLELVEKVAPPPTTVLVHGRDRHRQGARGARDPRPRARARAARSSPSTARRSPRALLESELFGHRRGAFTGARQRPARACSRWPTAARSSSTRSRRRRRRCRRSCCACCRRARSVRSATTATVQVDVRVIAATNRELEDEVKAGRFREDLYYRLRVFPIRIRRCASAREDIPALARHLTQRLAARCGSASASRRPRRSRRSRASLSRQHARAGERARARDPARRPRAPLTEDLLSDHIRAAGRQSPPGVLQSRTDGFEREQIVAALERAGGVQTRAAEELGITYRGLLKKMRRLGM